MWNILIQTASSYTSQKYFKQLIKDQWVAIGQLIIGKFAALLWLVHQLYTFPTVVGWRESHVEHFDPNVQFYTSQKYFKQLIKDQWVAMDLKLYSKLQVNLQLCCGLYTSCTPFPRLWDGEKVMWNILIQTAISYTSQTYFKQLIKDQWVAIGLKLYS